MLRTRATLTIALAALTLAACSPQTSDPAANPTAATPSATQSTIAAPETTTPTPTPRPPAADDDVTTPPEQPTALDGPASEENAKAVGRYFLALFPYAVATGDLADFDALSGKTCKYCSHLRGIVAEIHDAGHHGTGGAYQLGFTSAIEDEGGDFTVGIEYVETPSQTVAPDGSVVEDFPDTYSMKAVLKLAWSGSSWTVEAGKATEFGASQ